MLVLEGILVLLKSKKEFEFFCNWYFRAQQDSNFDAEQQFFYYYALIDHLMKSLQKERQDELLNQGLQFANGERGLLKFLLFQSIFCNSNSNTFETFNPLQELKESKKELLINKIKINKDDPILNQNSLPSFDIISALFLKIYDIRCELFHGETDLQNLNKKQEIEESIIVLKSFLNRLFSERLDSKQEES